MKKLFCLFLAVFITIQGLGSSAIEVLAEDGENASFKEFLYPQSREFVDDAANTPYGTEKNKVNLIREDTELHLLNSYGQSGSGNPNWSTYYDTYKGGTGNDTYDKATTLNIGQSKSGAGSFTSAQGYDVGSWSANYVESVAFEGISSKGRRDQIAYVGIDGDNAIVWIEDTRTGEKYGRTVLGPAK